ncbi:uncharacterized protein YkwD [Actinoplanes couchii]|uniref:CAP domain-containing protein n=1 Tax=Actinoplanes couchii TaxID=403638 RepID=UPI002859C5C7|nr:CAP domain-containing protein [Actinoplanes couchii]MDR6320616.1 uncharacterized protein YkwD [Actinoplanes couchii]
MTVLRKGLLLRRSLRRLAVSALLAPIAAVGVAGLFASPAQATEAKPRPGSWMISESQPGFGGYGQWTSGSSRTGNPSAGSGSWTWSPAPSTPGRSTPGTSAPTKPVKSAPATGGSAAKGSEQALQDEVNRLINIERANNGCAALTVNGQLTTAARAHSAWMAQTGTFSHTGNGGSSFVTRAKAAGYAQPSAENIAMGYRTAAETVNGWMNSPGHHANIVNCQSTTVGVGVVFATDGSPYYTQVFGY